jgi:hypothetical protein
MRTCKNLLVFSYLLFLASCTEQMDVATTQEVVMNDALATDIAQTSGQLASGTSFILSGNSFLTGSISARVAETAHAGVPGAVNQGKGGHKGIIDGLNLLAPNDELLAIIDAESAGDMRGFRLFRYGGAEITHYDSTGKLVVLPDFNAVDGPHGGHSGNQFPELDSLLRLIVKSKIDYKTGVTITRNDNKITRSGVIVIERKKSGTILTETIDFQNYAVNDIKISGKKTIVSDFNKTTGKGTVSSTVANGKFVFASGETAVWTSTKSRQSEVQRSSDNRRPISGTILIQVKSSIVSSSGAVIYSHQTTVPLKIDLSCQGKRRGPIAGKIDTKYRDNTIAVDYGDGSCENQTITITVNGETKTKTIGG